MNHLGRSLVMLAEAAVEIIQNDAVLSKYVKKQKNCAEQAWGRSFGAIILTGERNANWKLNIANWWTIVQNIIGV